MIIKKQNEYSVNDLSRFVLSDVEVMRFNNKNTPPYRYSNEFYIDNEEWLAYPKEPRLFVSNYGRLKLDGKILEQEDVRPNAGYLYIKNYEQLRTEKGFVLYDVDWVHEIVAKTWLIEPPKDGNIWDVHHINNNGYDNTPENLMWLKRRDHLRVHRLALERTLHDKIKDYFVLL